MAEKVRWLDEPCPICGGRMNSWDVKIGKALGYKNTICEKCVAKEYNRSVDEIREIMEDYFGIRPCKGI